MSRTAHFLADHHIWISAGAVASAWQTFQLLSLGPMAPSLGAFLFFGTLAGYSALSLQADEDGKDNFQRSHSCSTRHCLLLLGAIAALLLFAVIPRSGQPWAVIAAAVTLAYGFSIPPQGKPVRNLPFLKIFLISLTWAIASVIIPWSVRTEPAIPFPWLLFWGKFLFIFALTLPFDLRDRVTDREAGVRTLPNAFSWALCQTIGMLALFIGAGLVAWPLMEAGRYAALIPEAVAFALAAFGLLLIKPDHPKLYFTLGLDGLLLVPAALTLLIH